MARHNETGKKGEELACRFLTGQGYRIIERNWRCERKEIDIIARKGNLIIFIEVKTRGSVRYGEPEEFISEQKQRYLIHAAESYLIENDIDLESRFDVISVVISGNKQTVRHIQEAIDPWIQE